ncbi:MAG TPA: BsuPI-related putative proteinase inhibitor [Abditibacteriaceae bacterium]|nr:BsuPI-related putative proteinase inhibitor [Abditibacteriaceae bacterium]
MKHGKLLAVAFAATLMALPASATDEVTVRVWSPKTTYRPAEKVQFTMAARNRSRKPVTLRFTSGQTFDVSVTPQGPPNSRVRLGPLFPIWSWSRDRMFTQATTTLTLAPGATRRWYVGWSQMREDGQPAAPGLYLARAWLTTTGGKRMAPPFRFRLVGGTTNGGGINGDTGARRTIGVRGTIRSVRSADAAAQARGLLGTILVEGRQESDTRLTALPSRSRAPRGCCAGRMARCKAHHSHTYARAPALKSSLVGQWRSRIRCRPRQVKSYCCVTTRQNQRNRERTFSVLLAANFLCLNALCKIKARRRK